MKGEITKISDPLRNERGDIYHVVAFRLENGKSAITYLVKSDKNGRSYRNFDKWALLLHQGQMVDGLVFKGNLINADSPVVKAMSEDEKMEQFSKQVL